MKRQFIIWCLLLISTLITAQEFKTKRVTKSDFKTIPHVNNSLSEAVVLHHYRQVYFRQVEGVWETVTEVNRRIKIYHPDGVYTLKNSILTNANDKLERIEDFTITNYNLINNSIKSKKLSADILKKTKLNSEQVIWSWKLPKTSTGSIIDMRYTIISLKHHINEIQVQESIPVLDFKAQLVIPSLFKYNQFLTGQTRLSISDSTAFKDLKVISTSKYFEHAYRALRKVAKDSVLQYKEVTTNYSAKNIDALDAPNFVDNIQNYQSKIVYQLRAINLPGQESLKISKTWNVIFEDFMASPNFSIQPKDLTFLQPLVDDLRAKHKEKPQMLQAAFYHIQDHMKWNGETGLELNKTLETNFISKSGNAYSINLILFKLLKILGLDVHPIFLSSQGHGKPTYPYKHALDYMLVSAHLNGKDILLDATEKYNALGILPRRAHSTNGFKAFPDGDFESVNSYPKIPSIKQAVMNFSIDTNGSIKGNITTSANRDLALENRNKLQNTSSSLQIENLKSELNLDNIATYELNNKETLEQPLITSFDFETTNGIETSENQISISPLLFLALNCANPFQNEERKAPINFNYPLQKRFIINIKFPEKYSVIEFPKPLKLSMPDGLGEFVYNTSITETGLSVMLNFKLNQAVIPSRKYPELKAFFEAYINKINEHVIFVKQ